MAIKLLPTLQHTRHTHTHTHTSYYTSTRILCQLSSYFSFMPVLQTVSHRLQLLQSANLALSKNDVVPCYPPSYSSCRHFNPITSCRYFNSIIFKNSCFMNGINTTSAQSSVCLFGYDQSSTKLHCNRTTMLMNYSWCTREGVSNT